MDYRGQGAIEYLLIIAAAIIVVAIVIVAISGVATGGGPDAAAKQQAIDQNLLGCQANVLYMGGTGCQAATTVADQKAKCLCCTNTEFTMIQRVTIDACK